MIERDCDAYPIQIYIAGDEAVAAQCCRQFALRVGFCVNLRSTRYIYTGGEEVGVVVECINYARFPKVPAEMETLARALAEELRVALCQHSFTVQTPNKSLWVSYRPESA